MARGTMRKPRKPLAATLGPEDLPGLLQHAAEGSVPAVGALATAKCWQASQPHPLQTLLQSVRDEIEEWEQRVAVQARQNHDVEQQLHAIQTDESDITAAVSRKLGRNRTEVEELSAHLRHLRAEQEANRQKFEQESARLEVLLREAATAEQSLHAELAYRDKLLSTVKERAAARDNLVAKAESLKAEMLRLEHDKQLCDDIEHVMGHVSLTQGVSPMLIAAMQTFPELAVTQRAAITGIQHTAIWGSVEVPSVVDAEKLLRTVLEAVRRHINDAVLVTGACRVMWKLVTLVPHLGPTLLQAGGVMDLLLLIRQYFRGRRFMYNAVGLLKLLVPLSDRLQQDQPIHYAVRPSSAAESVSTGIASSRVSEHRAAVSVAALIAAKRRGRPGRLKRTESSHSVVSGTSESSTSTADKSQQRSGASVAGSRASGSVGSRLLVPTKGRSSRRLDRDRMRSSASMRSRVVQYNGDIIAEREFRVWKHAACYFLAVIDTFPLVGALTESCLMTLCCVSQHNAWRARVLVEGVGLQILVQAALKWVYRPIAQACVWYVLHRAVPAAVLDKKTIMDKYAAAGVLEAALQVNAAYDVTKSRDALRAEADRDTAVMFAAQSAQWNNVKWAQAQAVFKQDIGTEPSSRGGVVAIETVIRHQLGLMLGLFHKPANATPAGPSTMMPKIRVDVMEESLGPIAIQRPGRQRTTPVATIKLLDRPVRSRLQYSPMTPLPAVKSSTILEEGGHSDLEEEDDASSTSDSDLALSLSPHRTPFLGSSDGSVPDDGFRLDATAT